MGPIEQYTSHKDWPHRVAYIGANGAAVFNSGTSEHGEVVELSAYGTPERDKQLDELWAECRRLNKAYHGDHEAPVEVHIPTPGLGRFTPLTTAPSA